MIELSRELALLAELTDAELERIRSITETRHHEAGDVILKQGEPVESVYIVLDGNVRVTAVMAEEDELVRQDEEVLVRLGPGEVFGELSFVTGEAPHLSIIAEEPAAVAAISQEKLRELIDDDALICRKILSAITRTLVGRLRATGRELVLSRYFIRG